MNNLEFPGNDERLDPNKLYLARGDEEISLCRPYLIGDVFDGVSVPNGAGGEKKRRVAILQHPLFHAEGWRQSERFDPRGKGFTAQSVEHR